MSKATRVEAAGAEAAIQSAFEILNEVAILSQLGRARLEASLPGELNSAQFGVLNHFVRLGGPRTPAELACAFQVTRGAMTQTLQPLVRAGLVEVRPHPDDRRSKQIRITPRGRRLRARAIRSAGPELAAFSEALGRQKIEAALPFLRRMRHWLDENR